jgi:hypothetical protein
MNTLYIIPICKSFKPANAFVHYDALPDKRMGGYGVRLVKAFKQWSKNRKVEQYLMPNFRERANYLSNANATYSQLVGFRTSPRRTLVNEVGARSDAKGRARNSEFWGNAA